VAAEILVDERWATLNVGPLLMPLLVQDIPGRDSIRYDSESANMR